jgi:excisionase family DNA binding protein
MAKWLTLKESARYSNASEATLRREAQSGRLRGYKVGGRRVWRFRAEDIDAWFERTNGERVVSASEPTGRGR